MRELYARRVRSGGTRPRVTAAALSLLVLGAFAALTSAQSTPRTTTQGTLAVHGSSSDISSSGTMPLSASVMGTFLIRNIGAGDALELLVLWRGTPGWFTKGGRSGNSGGGNGTVWQHRFYQGDFEFELTADLTKRTLTLLGQTVDLKTGNIILVDDVVAPGGGRIVRTFTVNARLDEAPTPARILPVLGRSQPLRDYLRCEAALPDPKYQAALAPLCARILAITPD